MTDQEWAAISGGLIKTQAEAEEVAKITGRSVEQVASDLRGEPRG